jgi:ketosteroid isomerase-like protein
MSQENVEIVRKGVAAFAKSERLSEFFAPDVVWDMSTFSGWPGRSEFRGFDEFNEFLDAWIEPYGGWSYEVEKILDAGGNRVVATVHQRGKPRGSDSWIDASFAIIYTIEEELIQRGQVYASTDEALEAAGLSV